MEGRAAFLRRIKPSLSASLELGRFEIETGFG
jgi:hypothetical protein